MKAPETPEMSARTAYQPGTAASAFERVRRGEDPHVALGDFLDDWGRTAASGRPALVREPIAPTSGEDLTRWAAYFAATVEQLCALDDLASPTWVGRDEYRLRDPWFLVSGAALRAWLLVSTPVPFKRRNIFNGESSLIRV